MLLGLAVGVGLLTGGAVWLFREGIDFFQWVREGLSQLVSPLWGVWAILPILAFAGLIVGWLMQRYIGEERHHGVPGLLKQPR
jgi:H+/Cl- antiporter ClcA